MRVAAWLWSPACAAAAAFLWPASRTEVLVAGLAASALVMLASRRFPKSLNDPQVFFLDFGLVFGLKAAAFLGLLALSFWGGLKFLPLLATYVAGVVGGTLAVGVDLAARLPKRAAHAR